MPLNPGEYHCMASEGEETNHACSIFLSGWRYIGITGRESNLDPTPSLRDTSAGGGHEVTADTVYGTAVLEISKLGYI
jgi:hypothetical protein